MRIMTSQENEHLPYQSLDNFSLLKKKAFYNNENNEISHIANYNQDQPY